MVRREPPSRVLFWLMRFSSLIGTVLLIVAARPLASQTPNPASAPSPVEISGLMFGSFNMRTDSAARAALGGKRPSAFSIDRIYVNFRAPAGDNGALRVTTDIFQNTNPATNGYFQGWAIRMKYAWFEYTMLRDALGKGSSLLARVGSINNVIIDPAVGAWPRFFNPIAVERVPYFSSADVGAGALLTFPNHMGDVYVTVMNGPGYNSYEKDRFKDPAIRVLLTPLANRESGYFKTLQFMPWYYKGFVGSQFAAGGAGQVGSGQNGAITDPLTRDRYGVLAGVRDRRLTFFTEMAWQHDQSESGSNTAASPRTVGDSIGRMLDGYIVARPLEIMNPEKRSPFLLVARYDHLTPNVKPSSGAYAGTTPSYDFTTLAAAYELNQRLTVALDWQLDRPSGYPPATGTNVRPPRPTNSTVFFHWNAVF
jgi:hypothetical protein